MLALTAALFILNATPAALLYGGDATLATELANELDTRRWKVVRAATAEPPTAAHPGQHHYKQGRQAYDELLFEEAIPELQKAVVALESGTRTPEQWRDYFDAVLYLALVYDAIGSSDKADATLDRLAPYALNADIADGKFPPPFRQKVAERLQVKPVKTGGIRIETLPQGAEVFLNGQPIGKTPITIENLPGAGHSVTLRSAGFQSYTKLVYVQAGFGVGADATPEWVRVPLTPLEGPAMATATTTLRNESNPGTAETAAFLKTQQATEAKVSFFLVASPNGLIAAALQSDGSWRGPARFAPDALQVPPRRAQLVKQLAYWTKPEEPVKPVAALPVNPEPTLGKKESSSRWWLWTGLGVLAAGGATAAAIAAADQPDRPASTTGDVIIGW